jgi:hypothetical protein
MLFGERITVYFEDHTVYTDTLCGQNVEFVPQRKYYVSDKRPNLLILFGKQSLFIVRTIRNTQIHCVDRIWSLYLTGNT